MLGTTPEIGNLTIHPCAPPCFLASELFILPSCSAVWTAFWQLHTLIGKKLLLARGNFKAVSAVRLNAGSVYFLIRHDFRYFLIPPQTERLSFWAGTTFVFVSAMDFGLIRLATGVWYPIIF